MNVDETNQALLREVQALRTRLSALERQQDRPFSRPAWRRATALLAGLAAVVGGGAALAASSVCPNGIPYCFNPNEPAVASELNANFAALKTWLEAKTGPTGAIASPSGDITTGRLNARTFVPTYADWAANAQGPGGAAIVNDNAGYKALMIAGNTSAGGARVVKLYDNVSVSGTLSVNGPVVSGGITSSGSVISNGYQVSCATGTSGYHFGFCCRINTRTGATACRNGTTTSFSAWSDAAAPFAGTTDGTYSLDCAGHSSSANWPICCRTDATGATSCVTSVSAGALSWSATPAPW